MLAQPYDWILRCSAEVLLILIFVFILLRPLWKLVQGRLSLIIVFSKAIASLIRLLIDMPGFLTNYILNFSPYLYVFFTNGILFTMETALTTHLLAMAINRAHAMIFPFHYNSFSTKKRNFYTICAILWIFSICNGFLYKSVREWTNYSVSLFSIVQKICMSCAALCYTIIGCKMFWLKYWSAASGSGAQAEKDPLKIMIICFTSLFLASLRYIILEPFITSTQSWPDVPRTMFYWLTFASSSLLSPSGEELCMLFLLRDYRRGVAEQILGLIGCKKHSKTASKTTTITTVASFKKIPPVIVKAAPPLQLNRR